MTARISGLLAGYAALPVQPPEAGKGVNAGVFVYRQIITLASQPTTDTELLAKLNAGDLFLALMVTASASLGSSTIAVGTAAAPTKYKTAATFTTVSSPVWYGLSGAHVENPLSAQEDVILTIAAAALPASGTLITHIFVSRPN